MNSWFRNIALRCPFTCRGIREACTRSNSRDLLRLAVLALAIAATPTAQPVVARADDQPTATVLVIHLAYRGYAPLDKLNGRLQTALEESSTRRVDVQVEYVDAMVTRGEDYERAVFEYIRLKYAHARIAVIVGIGAQGTQMAVRLRAALYPNAGLVYASIDSKILSTIDLGGNVTGASTTLDIRATAALAHELVPRATRIAMVIGDSDNERAWFDRAVSEIQSGAPGLEVIPLFALDRGELKKRISDLPLDSVIIWGTYRRGPGGSVVSPDEIFAEARQAARVPMFCVFEYDFGRGIVGGHVVDLERQGDLAGSLAARIVNGESATMIPPVNVTDLSIRIDWREIQRWGIDERNIPADALISFQEQTIWDVYKWYLVFGVGVIIVQSMLIVGLGLQRRRRLAAQRALTERIEVEQVVAELSSRFANLKADDVEAALEDGLGAIRTLVGADRTSLVLISGDGRLEVAHSVAAPDVEPLSGNLDADSFPEIFESLASRDIVLYSHSNSASLLPPLRQALEKRSVFTCIAVPLHSSGVEIGALSIVTNKAMMPGDAEHLARLRLLADAFANAIARKRGAAEVRKSAALSEAVLASMSAEVCVLNRESRIVATNEAWRRANDKVVALSSGESANERCDSDVGVPAVCVGEAAERASAGIRAVLNGTQPTFGQEYRATTMTDDNWYYLTVEPLRQADGGVVLSNRNITVRKRAELDAHQRRQELAHVSRVSTMGELVASIVHELKQPLTGVLANAQAAVRFLQLDPPDVDQVGEILVDIIEDDRRADEVIRRLRSMLQAGAIEPAEVDLRSVVDEVTKLLASDAVLRGVVVESESVESVPRVLGDRIQIQQVLLNLVVNAMDAVKDVSAHARRVTIRVETPDPRTVIVSVSDCGKGIDHDKLGRIFQPFYTTKSQGMGMGLSIARTIVEAHGGVLWAKNNEGAGASFLFRLPGVEAAAASGAFVHIAQADSNPVPAALAEPRARASGNQD